MTKMGHDRLWIVSMRKFREKTRVKSEGKHHHVHGEKGGQGEANDLPLSLFGFFGIPREEKLRTRGFATDSRIREGEVRTGS